MWRLLLVYGLGAETEGVSVLYRQNEVLVTVTWSLPQVATILEKRKRKARPVAQYTQPAVRAAAAGDAPDIQDGETAAQADSVQPTDLPAETAS